jgi:hypothetical protein
MLLYNLKLGIDSAKKVLASSLIVETNKLLQVGTYVEMYHKYTYRLGINYSTAADRRRLTISI